MGLIRPLASQHDVVLDRELPACAGAFVMADSQKLAQVLLNLLSNAVKYNRPLGRVRISCERRDGALLAIAVADTGPGIPSARMGELFTPFARLGADQTDVEGTGLGLALSKRLTEAMGGLLEVDSVVDVGTTFRVVLPLAAAPGDFILRPDAEREPAVEGGRAGTVLCIEDNLANLELIESILAGEPGIRLVGALQGRMGLDLAWQHQPDLILLDLHLPDMNGDEALMRLREDPRTRTTPVIVISADATRRQVERLLALGAQRYLTKPLNLDEFLDALHRYLPVGPRAARNGV
jgi:CheY-like chemotaxis protein